jgi:hypothetical protein
MEFVHIQDVAKKNDPSAGNCVLNRRRWSETDIFRENAPANPSGPETYPRWCCALNYGRYVEEGPPEGRNSPFWLLFEQVILGCKGTLMGRKRPEM